MPSKESRRASELLDCVESTLTCAGCDRVSGGVGVDDLMLAIEAASGGWRVTRSGDVLCGECKRRPEPR